MNSIAIGDHLRLESELTKKASCLGWVKFQLVKDWLQLWVVICVYCLPPFWDYHLVENLILRVPGMEWRKECERTSNLERAIHLKRWEANSNWKLHIQPTSLFDVIFRMPNFLEKDGKQFGDISFGGMMLFKEVLI